MWSKSLIKFLSCQVWAESPHQAAPSSLESHWRKGSWTGGIKKKKKKGTTEIRKQKESLPLYSSFSLPRRLGVCPSFTPSYIFHTSVTLNICRLAIVQCKARGMISCPVLAYSSIGFKCHMVKSFMVPQPVWGCHALIHYKSSWQLSSPRAHELPSYICLSATLLCAHPFLFPPSQSLSLSTSGSTPLLHSLSHFLLRQTETQTL